MYRLVRNMKGEIAADVVERIADCAFIPSDLNNTDWQRYQEWLAAGNTPEDPA